MPNILINPNSGVIEFSTGIAGGALFDSNITSGNRAVRLIYDNFGGINLTSYVNITGSGFISGQDRFSIDGTNGRLFSVTDNLSGSLFSVNDIAGLPIIEAFDDNTVVMGAYNKNDFVLSGNSLGLGGFPNTGTAKLYISGNLVVSGNSSFSNRPTVNGSGIAFTGEVYNLNYFQITGSQNNLSGFSSTNSFVYYSGSATGYAIIPNDTTFNFPTGAQINLMRIGSGNLIVSGASGVNVRSADNRSGLRSTNSVATISKFLANDWLLFGDIA